MRLLLTGLLAACLMAAPAYAQEQEEAPAEQPEQGGLWRWVDDDGVVHYSDKPVEGAERIELRRTQTYSGDDALRVRPSARDANARDERSEPERGYSALRIVKPEHDSVAWNVGGEIMVQVEAEPALRSGDKVALFYNGEIVDGTPAATTSIAITGVYRGTHTIYATIVGADGNQVIQSEPVSFHVRQHSIKHR